KKDGSLTARSQVLPLADLELVTAFAKKKIESLGQAIIEGKIPLSPLDFGGMLPCGYCEFRRACGFDARLPGCEARAQRVTSKDALKKMRDDMKQKDS
ncbi:MAG: hypothetical protein IJU50_02570, partial [Lachnospiraceae bacterium]|nr:hypothetical protein [Lachnospiraceae bacterium]